MGFWEKIQKDIRENIKEGLEIVKEGSSAVSEKIEKLTDEGKKTYKIFTLNMKVQDEFAKLGGKVYDLSFKPGDPMSNKRVLSIISKIKKHEETITTLKKNRKRKKTTKTGPVRTRRKTTTQSGPSRRRKTVRKS
jgi:hypothetical protein